MNDQDYICKAVKLADGWWFYSDNTYRVNFLSGNFIIEEIPQGHKDALAAQLVRQVDALDKVLIQISPLHTVLKWRDTYGDVMEFRRKERSEGTDRTTNTIKAIVDSTVLQRQATK